MSSLFRTVVHVIKTHDTEHQLLMFSMDGSGNCGVLVTKFQSILAEGHQMMATLRDGVFNLDDKGMSFRERVSKFANECFAQGSGLLKNLWILDENATKEKKLEYFNKWDNEMRSMNAWVDVLWLSLAVKMLNINLRIYSPRWKKSGSTKCIDPNQPMDVHDVPLSSSVGGPTLKVIRVTSAISTNAHYKLLLDAEEVSSLQYTYGASTDGETDDTRFIMFHKGDEVQTALEACDESEDGSGIR